MSIREHARRLGLPASTLAELMTAARVAETVRTSGHCTLAELRDYASHLYAIRRVSPAAQGPIMRLIVDRGLSVRGVRRYLDEAMRAAEVAARVRERLGLPAEIAELPEDVAREVLVIATFRGLLDAEGRA